MKTDIEENQTPKTQAEEVLYHLKYIGALSSIQAIKEYGITRLAARVYELKDQGWDVRSEDREFTTRHGKKSSYSEYYLVREN